MNLKIRDCYLNCGRHNRSYLDGNNEGRPLYAPAKQFVRLLWIVIVIVIQNTFLKLEPSAVITSTYSSIFLSSVSNLLTVVIVLAPTNEDR